MNGAVRQADQGDGDCARSFDKCQDLGPVARPFDRIHLFIGATQEGPRFGRSVDRGESQFERLIGREPRIGNLPAVRRNRCRTIGEPDGRSAVRELENLPGFQVLDDHIRAVV
jgi:hypothetical protein